MENFKKMYINIPDKLNTIITYAREEALRLGSRVITTDHLILGMIRQSDNSAIMRLMELGIDIKDYKQSIEQIIRQNDDIMAQDANNEIVTPLSSASSYALKIMYLEARSLRTAVPDAIHLLLAIMRGQASAATDYLHIKGIYYETVKAKFQKGSNQYLNKESSEQLNEDEGAANSLDRLLDKLFDGPVEKAAEGAIEENKGENSEHIENIIPNDQRAIVRKKIVIQAGSKSKTPSLDSFGIDYTKAAREDKLDPVVGREEEIERVAQILGRRKKNNPILIGEPGVGKSAIAEGLAIKIAKREVAFSLLSKRVVSLDIGSIVAGTKFRGQFEERMKSILGELKNNPDVILFIDELHTLVGAGGAAGSLDAANMLKPALARGEIQCIGATTLDEYREVIEKDGALERRFQKVLIEPTDFEQTFNILKNIKSRYENHHNVIYTEEALKSCISLSQRYISDRCLPDKAIDIMDEAGSRAHIKNQKIPKSVKSAEEAVSALEAKKSQLVNEKNFDQAALINDLIKEKRKELEILSNKWKTKNDNKAIVIDKGDIEAVMSNNTRIPIQRLAESEGTKLMNMGKVLKESIIGQDEAVDKVTRAILRNRAGLKDPYKPIGTFLFLGPTGVGKTHLAKVLANNLFDTDDALIRVDMSEFMEKFSVSRLIGAPPGYIGYNEGGELSEKVRRKPYSVILLDEIEKAHPDIFNLLLQVLDEGRLTDSNGRHIDFRNTILILTSNVGTKELKDFGRGVGFSVGSKEETIEKNREIIDKAIKKQFTPEFLNRLDEQILFNPLTESDLEKIIDIELKGLKNRVSQVGYNLKVGSAAKKFVAKNAYDPQYGARPLKRAIQKMIEDPVSEAIITGKVASNGTIEMVLKGDNLVVKGL